MPVLSRAIWRWTRHAKKPAPRRTGGRRGLQARGIWTDRPINSVAGLDSWYRQLDDAGRRRLEWPLAELLPGEGSDADRFPKYFPLGEVRLALHYHFSPGAQDDGVTLDVPLHLLKALDPARLEWLVPGLVGRQGHRIDPRPAKAQRRNSCRRRISRAPSPKLCSQRRQPAR